MRDRITINGILYESVVDDFETDAEDIFRTVAGKLPWNPMYRTSHSSLKINSRPFAVYDDPLADGNPNLVTITIQLDDDEGTTNINVYNSKKTKFSKDSLRNIASKIRRIVGRSKTTGDDMSVDIRMDHWIAEKELKRLSDMIMDICDYDHSYFFQHPYE